MAFTKVVGPGIHTLSNIASHNINSSGIITATKFVGPFDSAIIGGGTTITSDGINVTGIVTATQLDINGNGDISGNLVIGGNLTANGDFTTLNTTLREVELLRVDANSSAIAGIITQRGSGDIFSVYDTSTEVFKIADGGNTSVASDKSFIIGTNSSSQYNIDFKQNSSNNRNTIEAYYWDFKTADLQIRNESNNQFLGYFWPGEVALYASGGKKFSTVGSGIKVHTVGDGHGIILDNTTYRNNITAESNLSGANSPILQVDGKWNNTQVAYVDLSTGDDTTDKDDGIIRFFTKPSGGTIAERVRITSDGFVGIGVTNPEDYDSGAKNLVVGSTGQEGITIRSSSPNTGNLFFNDGLNLIAGISFKHDSTASSRYFSFSINNGSSFIEQLRIQDGKLIFSNDQNSYISGGSDVFRFTTGGTERVRINASGNVKLPDAAELQFGGALHTGDGDLKIFHDSSATNNVISGHTGSLNIRNYDTNSTSINLSARNNILLQTNLNETAIQCLVNGAVEIFHDGGTYTTPKLRTTATGIEVTGEVATAQDYPNSRPTLDLNFAAEKKLDPRITYSRSGPASFTDKFGKVVVVGDNVPRFDHDPVTRESKGLLVEESRLNYVDNSNDLSQWNRNINSSVNVANTTETLSPEGINNSTKMTGGSNSGMSRDSIITLSTTTSYTASIFAKKGTTNSFRLELGSGANNIVTFFNLDTKAFSSSAASGYFASYSTSYVDYPNGWVRVILSGTTGGSVAGTVNFAVYGLSGGYAYFWGAQAEVGAFPTSLIPTEGASVTRGYEAVTLEESDFSDVFGTEFKEFSLVADYDNTQTDDGTGYAIIDLWGEAGGYDDRIEWFKYAASPYHLATRAFGQGNPTFANGTPAASTKAKAQRFATSWYVPDYSNTSSRRFVVSMGGEAVDVINDSSGTTVPLITRMGIGCNPTRLDFSPGLLHFKRLMVYNKTLSDGQLQNLSAQ